MALELSTYSVEQTARSKCCAKTCGIYELAFAEPEQSFTYTRRRKKSSHRLRVATKRFPGPSLVS